MILSAAGYFVSYFLFISIFSFYIFFISVPYHKEFPQPLVLLIFRRKPASTSREMMYGSIL